MSIFHKSKDGVEIGKLLIATLGVVSSPTGLGIATVTADAYLTAYDKLVKGDASLVDLAKEIQTATSKRLKSADFHMPAQGPVLLPQMLEAALPDPQDLIDNDLDAAAILEVMIARLHDPEHLAPEMLQAFQALYAPALETLCQNQQLFDALRVERWRKGTGDTRQIINMIHAASSLNLASVIEDVQQASRSERNALAGKFGIERPEDLSEAKLTQELDKRAEQFQSQKAFFEQVDERMSRVLKLKAETKEASSKLDFEKVDRLLATVEELDAETVCETKTLRGRNALLRNRPDEAYTHFSSAADLWAKSDRGRAVVTRFNLSKMLQRHGVHQGSDGLSYAIDLVTPTIAQEIKEIDARLWASAHNHVAVFKSMKAEGIRGTKGVKLLAEAAASYRKALSVCCRSKEPEHYANLKVNLGVTYGNQAERSQGSAAQKLYTKAERAQLAALDAITREKHPKVWAKVQSLLATTYFGKAKVSEGRLHKECLTNAITASQAALTVQTREDDPSDWAESQTTLGAALRDLSGFNPGHSGAAMLASAKSALQDALELRSREQSPMLWAMTRKHLADLELAWAQRDDAQDPMKQLISAQIHVDLALQAYKANNADSHVNAASELRQAIVSAMNTILRPT